MSSGPRKSVAIIVAHPDDETLWMGGTLLCNRDWDCFILCMSRKNDTDRAPKFLKALKTYNADGCMGDLDDGPEQKPVRSDDITSILTAMLPDRHFDMIFTHSPMGEYTRHLRHEEIGKTMMHLWIKNKLACDEFSIFAYHDNNRMHFPEAITTANNQFLLPEMIWKRKYKIITNIYGFDKDSWEAETTPKTEAFYSFKDKDSALTWLNQSTHHESAGTI